MSEENWTEVIKPQRKVFGLGFKELIKYKDLIFLFVRRDFVAFYKQTVLGPFWYVLQPLMQTAVYSIMFGSIFDISKETGVPSILFYLIGTVSWWYFSQSLIKTANTFTANAHIFGKVYFPRLTVPVSVLLSNLIGFGIQFMLFVCFFAYFAFTGETSFSHALPNLWKIPLLVIIMAVLGLGMGLIISSLTTKYKDFKQFIGFGVQLLMFASPVIIPLSIVYKRFPPWTHFILEYNPMTGVIEGFRSIFFAEYDFDWGGIGYTASFALVMFVLGILLFNKTEQNFVDTV
jgi:lipopolysaccharide transport system permease protein